MTNLPNDDSEECERQLAASWSVGSLRPWLKNLAIRELPPSLRGRLDSSDVVQQTLLDAWRGASHFRGTTLPERLAWLKVIMRRVILQHHRTQHLCQKRGGNRERLQSELTQTNLRLEQLAQGTALAPDEQAATNETALQVAAAIDQLSWIEQEVIRLRQFEKLSHEHIAAKLEKSPAAIRMIWLRALKKLRAILTS